MKLRKSAETLVATARKTNNPNLTNMEDEYEEIILENFEEGDEPRIRIYKEGHLRIVFQFMPPFYDRTTASQVDFSVVEDLDVELVNATGVQVIWEDREFFFIPNPDEYTIPRIKRFIANYWKTHKKKEEKFA